jgi:hypothetical protein
VRFVELLLGLALGFARRAQRKTLVERDRLYSLLPLVAAVQTKPEHQVVDHLGNARPPTDRVGTWPSRDRRHRNDVGAGDAPIRTTLRHPNSFTYRSVPHHALFAGSRFRSVTVVNGMERGSVTRYRPGEICRETVGGLGAVLITALLRVERLDADRRLEIYSGCAFEADTAPQEIETYAIVVPAETRRVSRSVR